MSKLAALVLAALCLAASPGLAQPPAAAQQAADEQIVRSVLHAGSFDDIARAAPELQRVLDHAPPSYPRIERQPGVTIVRDEEGVGGAANLRLLVGAAVAHQQTTIKTELNIYGDAAFLLATYANETHRSEAAITYADRGLALQPDNAMLLTEKTTALEYLKRPADALTAIDRWLGGDPIVGERTRARVLRARGYALVELKRFDEGEAAYKQSLELEPDHKGALNELTYIARLKAGAAPTTSVTTTADKAKSGDYQPKP